MRCARRRPASGYIHAGKVNAVIVREIRLAWRLRDPADQSFTEFAIEELRRLQLRWHVSLSAQALREIVRGTTWSSVR